MFRPNKEIITGRGSVPITPGLVDFGPNIDLLTMPGSGFSRTDLFDSQKIASMNFISSDTLRVAFADFGTFLSSSLVVFDVNVNTDVVFVLGTYQFDATVTDRFFYSCLAATSGQVVLAGKGLNMPFLVEWNSTFNEPVFYEAPYCGKSIPRFFFSLPIRHRGAESPFPASYGILQENGLNFTAIVTGLRSGSGGSLLDDSTGLPAFVVAEFLKSDLSLAGFSLPPSMLAPPMLDPSDDAAGFVGPLTAQFVGARKPLYAKASRAYLDAVRASLVVARADMCVIEKEDICESTNSFYLDAILRVLDSSYGLISEQNYLDTLGQYQGVLTGDISQAPLVAVGPGYTVLASDGAGISVIQDVVYPLSRNKCIALTQKDGIIYTLEFTDQGLGLLTYKE